MHTINLGLCYGTNGSALTSGMTYATIRLGTVGTCATYISTLTRHHQMLCLIYFWGSVKFDLWNSAWGDVSGIG